MCDIEYEEFDNKESIYQEFNEMITDQENTQLLNHEIENPVISLSKLCDKKKEFIKNLSDSVETVQAIETPKPVRMSELYSYYSKSWKTRLKARETMIDNYTDNSNDLNAVGDSEKTEIDADSDHVENTLKNDCLQLNEKSLNEETFVNGNIIHNEVFQQKVVSTSLICDVEEEEKGNENDFCLEGKVNVIKMENKNEIEVEYASRYLNRPRKVMVETCSCSLNDEMLEDITLEKNKLNPTKLVSAGFGCDFEDENKMECEKIGNEIKPKSPIKRTSLESSSENAFSHRKSIYRNLASRNVAVASFGCSFDDEDQKPVKKQEMQTTSTETDICQKAPMESSFSDQANDVYNSIEEKILPFVNNPHSVELKFKGRLSVFQNACVKQIAQKHKLMMKSFGKGRDSFILLRKKIDLLNSQKLFLEMKKKSLEQKKEQAEINKAKQERLLNPPKMVSSSCQVDLASEEKEKLSKSKRAARRNRKLQWELKQKEKLKRHSAAQTIENGFYVCPYCENDIPESLQFIHYPHCLEKYRSQTQMKSKAVNGISIQVKSYRPLSAHRKKRSKSRDKINHSKLDDLKKELEKVHDNDINAIVNIVTELDGKCSISGCNKKKKKFCSMCAEDYCHNHFSPNDKNSDKHFNCPVALENLEVEKQKKLGNKNPLLKTVEQLNAPQFVDGVMIKRKKQVQLIDRPSSQDRFEDTSNQIHPINFQTSINQTRTRNGPMLSFERSNLRKELREKISLLSDKRSK